MDKALHELRQLATGAENRRTETGIPRLAMVRGAIPEHQLAAVYEPMVNLILQGGKRMTVGGRTLHYDPATYFVMSVTLPAVGAVHPAADGAPYLAVALTLDPGVLHELLADLPPAFAELGGQGAAFSVAAVTEELMDAWVRLLRLLRRPEEIAALAPAYEREILFRVLQGPHGGLLREIATPDSRLARVQQAILCLRRDYARPLRVAELAERAAMSESAFHRHFKAVTASSPLQFQKQLRLLAARQLLFAEGRGVTDAALAVGYESATQFSREYVRLFGRPPSRDLARLAGG